MIGCVYSERRLKPPVTLQEVKNPSLSDHFKRRSGKAIW